MGDTLVNAGAANRRLNGVERRLDVLSLKLNLLIEGVVLILGVLLGSETTVLLRLGEINCQIATMVHGLR